MGTLFKVAENNLYFSVCFLFSECFFLVLLLLRIDSNCFFMRLPVSPVYNGGVFSVDFDLRGGESSLQV